MFRKTRLAFIGIAAAILCALLAAHAQPVRALVLRRVVEATRSSFGIELRAESLSYNLLTLSTELRSVQLAIAEKPAEPFAAADGLVISFGARTLIGDVSVARLSIVSPRIHIRREADGSDNVPRVHNDASTNARFVLPPIRVDDLDVSFQQPAASAQMRGAAVQFTTAEGGHLAATIKAQHGVTMTAGDRTFGFDAFGATVNFGDDQLDLRDLTASRPDAQLNASGAIALRGDASTVDLTVNASSELAPWWDGQPNLASASRPTGRVHGTARITGLLSEPTVTVETRSDSVTWSDLQVNDVRAKGSYRLGQLSLNSFTFDFAGGTVEGRGDVVLDDARRASRIEARWVHVDASRIAGAARLAGIVEKSGSAVVEWRADGNRSSPLVNIVATTGVIVPAGTIPLVVEGSGHANRWRIKASSRDANAVDLSASADIELDSQRWPASTIAGRVVLRTTDLPGAIRQAQGFGAPVAFEPATAAGTIEIDATIDGTLGAIRSTGRMSGRAVTVAGLPQLDLDAAFAADVVAKTSIGTLRMQAPRLESATFAAADDVTLGGSLVTLATWSGPVSDPVVDGIVTGRNLAIDRDGSPSIAATGGVFDGVFKGRLKNLVGDGKLAIGSLAIGGRGVGTVNADLSLSEGSIRVTARAPGVNTTVDASIGLEDPRPFHGHGTLADSEIAALLRIAGLAESDADTILGRVSSSISFKGEMQNSSSTTVALDIAPINATVLDVPLTMSRGLRASLTGSRLEIEDVETNIGDLAVRFGGTLDTGRTDARFMLDVDGGVEPLTPWLMHLTGNDDLAAAGSITGHIETRTESAGLAMTGTLNATLSTLSRGDRVLAKDVSTSIVLTGQRAEVRDAKGSVLGGQLEIAGDAPLLWLNPWLPAGLQIAQQAVADRPGTLEGTASFEFPALFELLGRNPIDGFGGRFELSASVAASKPDPAAVAGDIRIERAEVNTKNQRYAQSDITRFRLADGALTVERLDWRGPGSTVIGRGRIGLLEGIETDFRLDVDTDLGILGTLMSGRATGRVKGGIDLHGEPGELRVTSDATLSDGSLLIPGQRIFFAGWSGHVRLEDQALSITKMGGTVNGGSIRVDGRLPFEQDSAGGVLTIVASDVLIDVPRGLHSQLSADLVWRLIERRAQLQGNVEITANQYTEPVTRILELVNSLSQATRGTGEGTLPAWLADTALDITFDVTDPILIDNSVGTVELLPDLRLGGTIDSPALSGRVDVVDNGRITIGGRLYRLRDSELRFAPDDGLVPTLDAIGDTRIGNYDVTVRISGTPDRVETSFSSVPPLGERDLQSLIVTGQAGEGSLDSRQSDDDTFAAAATATDILGFAGKFVGLDSVRIGAADLELVSKDVSTAQHLTVLKSLGSSFDLIFSDNLEDGSVTWVLVWKPTAVNEIRASSVEDGTRSLEFRRTIVFGPGSPGRTSAARRDTAAQSRTIVDAVRITGAPGFLEEELSKKLELGAGDRFNVRQWIQDRNRLENFYRERGYQRVRIASSRNLTADRSRVSLTYDIERGPRTIIEVTGDQLPGEVLDAMYDAWRGLPIADVVRTEFERIARQGLARRGYYQPMLQLEFPSETRDLARVTMQVSRGPQTRRLTIAWSGNREVSNAELDALAAPHLAQSPVWLDSQALAWQIRQLYASRGHLRAGVTVGDPAFRSTDATLPIAIDEGMLSRLAAIELAGVDPARAAAAETALGLSIGEPLASTAPVKATRRLKAFYAGLGYRSSDVTHTLRTATDGSVSIAWAVKEGPLYVVKDVNVVGAETTSGALVRKAISLAPGDAMSQGAIDTTRRNLYDIGSFRRVDFDFADSAIQPENDQLPVMLTIRAEEQQRFQLKYGVQFTFDRSTDRGGGNALGGSVELRDRNFIGRAVQASVGAHWDPDLQTIGVLFSSPRLFGKRLRTNLYARDRREQDVIESTSALDGATLDDQRRELTLEQRWRPVSAFELVWGYNVSSRQFLLDQVTQRSDGGGLLAGPVVSVILDRRDSPFDATRGLFHSSSFQFGAESFGSELSYIRYLLRQSYYQPFGPLTAAASVRYGAMHRYSGSTPISIIDLFFNAGGTNSVRGYPEDSLSAINIAGFALGGTDLLVLNSELRFPITKRAGGALFVDAGNTFAVFDEIALDRLAFGAGVGVRIRTPLAPLRLDVAYPLSSGYERQGVRVHFSIGQMF